MKLKEVVQKAITQTACGAAYFHLGAVFVGAILQRDPTILNPFNFLGIRYLLPNIPINDHTLVLGWILLIATGMLIVIKLSWDRIAALLKTRELL